MPLLDPDTRSLYTAALTPPPGTRFDEAIGTSFSMDPTFLLQAPVYLALAAPGARSETDPLVLITAIKRYADRITAYVQRGRMLAPGLGKPSPLYGHLESMTVEVTAPGGVFHPKLWAIRFVDQLTGHVQYRLVVLTRNMTADNSWDLALRLDGLLGAEPNATNEPLAHLVSSLPKYATGSVTADRGLQAERFAAELRRVEWELPDGFKRLSFYLPGSGAYDWPPPKTNRLAIISPFCSDEPLRQLAQQSESAYALVSTPEALAGLKAETLALFSRRLHLHEAAETEEGEAVDPSSVDQGSANHGSVDSEAEPAAPNTNGLHAKAYLFETRRKVDYTHVVMGSANATNSALRARRNVEILVELVGTSRDVGSVADLIGPDGLGGLLVDFDATAPVAPDPQAKAAEQVLEDARAAVAGTTLWVTCAPAVQPETWELALAGELGPLEGISVTKVWPITVPATSAVELQPGVRTNAARLGTFSTASVTGLIAFELREALTGTKVTFVLNLPVDGMPEDRDAAILRTIISNRDGFIRYLLMLLGEEAQANLASVGGSEYEAWLRRMAAGEAAPLLEELTRTYVRDPKKLDEVADLVRILSTNAQDDVIPPQFTQLWSVFEQARADQDA